MQCQNSKKSDAYIQMILKRRDTYLALINLNMYHTWKRKILCKNSKYKILGGAQNEKLALLNLSCSASNF